MRVKGLLICELRDSAAPSTPTDGDDITRTLIKEMGVGGMV